jgi:hypothetical protein
VTNKVLTIDIHNISERQTIISYVHQMNIHFDICSMSNRYIVLPFDQNMQSKSQKRQNSASEQGK